MANRRCTQCGKEVLEGKRFCGGCGQAMTVPVSPSVADQAVEACQQCGTALVSGKRFCKQCGHPVGEPISVAEPVVAAGAVVGSEPAIPVCARCGATLVPGKRFCRQCGCTIDAVGSPAPAMPEAASLPVSSAAVPEPTSHSTPRWESTEESSPVSSRIAAEYDSGAASPTPRGASFAPVRVSIGISAVVLVMAGCIGAWYFYHHRTASVASAAVPTGQNQVAGSIAHLEQPAKPSASTDEPSALNPPQSKPAPGASPSVTTRSAAGSPVARQVTQAVARQPEPLPLVAPPPSPPAPAAQRSEMLHYQGPPVPYHGQVVFDHLPQARLKFKFDHQAWMLSIKPYPDGTKRVTLTSLLPGNQTNCDLGWEIVE